MTSDYQVKKYTIVASQDKQVIGTIFFFFQLK